MSFRDEPTWAVEEGRSVECTEDYGECRCSKRMFAVVSSSGLLIAGVLILVMVSLLQGKGDNSTAAQPDNQLFGDMRLSKPILSKAESTASFVSIKVELPSIASNLTTASQPGSIPSSNEQCAIAVNGWHVSAMEEDFPQYPSLDTLLPDWPGYADVMFGFNQGFNRTFDVEPNHTVLEDEEGVIFNIETVPEALPDDFSKPFLSEEELQAVVEGESGRFYQKLVYPPTPITPNVTLEVLSDVSEDNLVFAGGQGFVASAMMAFADHLPLSLAPDHLWAVITSGFAFHVNQYPEELRHKFVHHQGQLDLEIRADFFTPGQTKPDQWESLVFPQFTEEVGKHMNNTEVFNLLTQTKFSTTTPSSQAASQITLMATLKAYFRFTMVTLCGIPQIKLEGTRDDWQKLRDRTAQLEQWMMPNHSNGDMWIPDVVLPILDEFIRSYDGDINYCFWQTMVKFRLNGDGCDNFEFLSGWLPTLFPYLDTGGSIQANRYLRHWSESSMGGFRGPQPSQIPIQMASAPVLWKYFETDYHLHFHAGFRGVHQAQSDNGMLRPVLGWYISHDP